MNQRLSRRGFLKLGMGAAAGAAGAGLFFSSRSGDLSQVASAQTAPIAPTYFLAGTDGWISLPGQSNSFLYPDPLADQGKTTYVFGFANVTGVSSDSSVTAEVLAYKNKAQICAPLMYFEEFDATVPGAQPYVIRLTNLGLAQRPDLIDSHTVHWHGFRNAIPMFDGEPSSSIAVPIGRTFDYAYTPYEPGTYMYHCHFEDTEHVHMGMTGPVFVRPIQNKGSASTGFKAKYPGYSGPTIPAGKYAYNDQDGSTAYDREYVIFLSEVWNQSHWDDAHIQLPDWTDYKADFYLMNGRVYPDTLLPNATLVGNNPKAAIDTSQPPLVGAPTNGVAGDLLKQPYSSLVQCNANEKVLLRFINLGFTKATMTLSGLRMKVVGMDATLLRGKSDANGHYANGYYETNSLQIGPGESVDAIVTAPAFTGASGDHDSYPLFNRNLAGSSNNGMAGLGGQVTEVRVFNGTRPAQQHPNDL